jgi:hypothetical protein
MALGTADKKVWYPQDTGGTVVEAGVSEAIDNLYVFASAQSSTGKIKRVLDNPKVYNTSWLNPANLPTLNATLINTLLNSSSIEVLDVNTNIEINGSISCPSGKIIRFLKGGQFRGAVTITGGAVVSSDKIKIFDEFVNIVGLENEIVSLSWWLNSNGSNGNNALLKAYSSQQGDTYIDARNLDIWIGDPNGALFFTKKDKVTIDLDGSELKLNNGEYTRSVAVFDRITNLELKGKYTINGRYNDNITLGAKWTEKILGSEYFPEAQLADGEGIILNAPTTVAGVSASNIDLTIRHWVTLDYPSYSEGDHQFRFKAQGSPSGAIRTMSLYTQNRETKLCDISFPASYEGQYFSYNFVYNWGGTFYIGFSGLFRQGDIVLGWEEPYYFFTFWAPYDPTFDNTVGGFGLLKGSSLHLGEYTLKNLPLGGINIGATPPYNNGYQEVHIGESRHSSGILCQRSEKFYDKRVGEPRIYGAHENIQIDKVYMSDPEGNEEKVVVPSNPEYRSRAMGGVSIGGGQLNYGTDFANTIKSIRIGEIHADYWLSTIGGFRGVGNVSVDKVLITNFGKKPGFNPAWNTPDNDPSNPYPFLSQKFINIWKQADYDRDGGSLGGTKMTIGEFSVRGTSDWLLWKSANSNEELLTFNPTTGLRSITFNRLDTDMSIEGGTGQGYGGTDLGGSFTVDVLRLFKGAQFSVNAVVNEMHFMSPALNVTSTSIPTQFRFGVGSYKNVYQWYKSRLNMWMSGAVLPNNTVTNNTYGTEVVTGLHIENAIFQNAFVNDVYELNAAWATTPPEFGVRLHLKGVRGLNFSPFWNLIGTGVMWDANTWDSVYTTAEAAFEASRHYYEFKFEDCDLEFSDTTAILFTNYYIVTTNGSKCRPRFAKPVDPSKYSTWTFPLTNSKIHNCRVSVAGFPAQLIGWEPTINTVELKNDLKALNVSSFSEIYYVKENNRLYRVDYSDITSSDNGDTILTTPITGRRWKMLDFGGGAGIVDSFSLIANGSRPVSTGERLKGIYMTPNDNFIEVKVGLTPGGDELYSGPLTGSVKEFINYSELSQGSTTVYFTSPNFDGSKAIQIKIIKENI